MSNGQTTPAEVLAKAAAEVARKYRKRTIAEALAPYTVKAPATPVDPSWDYHLPEHFRKEVGTIR